MVETLEKHELPEYKELDTWGLCSNFFSNTSGKSLILKSRTEQCVRGSDYCPLDGILSEISRANSQSETKLDASIENAVWVFDGYIDVGDGCWRRNVLVTTLRCW